MKHVNEMPKRVRTEGFKIRRTPDVCGGKILDLYEIY